MGVYLLNMNRLYDPITEDARMSLVTGEGVPAGRASEQWGRPQLVPSSTQRGHAPRPSLTRGHGWTESAASASLFDETTDDEADAGVAEQVDLRPLRGQTAGRGRPSKARTARASSARRGARAAAAAAAAAVPSPAIAEEDELRTSTDAPAHGPRSPRGLGAKGASRAHLLSDFDGEDNDA